jgi:hypothetical protein
LFAIALDSCHSLLTFEHQVDEVVSIVTANLRHCFLRALDRLIFAEPRLVWLAAGKRAEQLDGYGSTERLAFLFVRLQV